jgi:hypothetical protein
LEIGRTRPGLPYLPCSAGGFFSLYINASSAPPFGGEAAASCPRPCGDGEELAVACAADIRMGFAGIRR